MPNNTDISGLNPNAFGSLTTTPLPMRAEKRIVPTLAVGLPQTSAQAFAVSAAMKPFTDYINIRIPGRGRNSDGVYDPSLSAYYRFLINPSQLSVSKSTMDAQSFSRGGWQFGVAGEGPTSLSLSGKTPGRYFQNGLTDSLAEFTQSYRNLEALEIVFENNGYWFEGEQTNEGPLAADSTRRLIQSHQDVELNLGEFQWKGMFGDLTIEESADTPYLSSFTLSFTAWKERYKAGTPYIDSIHNDLQRGHAKKSLKKSATTEPTLKRREGNSSFISDMTYPSSGVFSA